MIGVNVREEYYILKLRYEDNICEADELLVRAHEWIYNGDQAIVVAVRINKNGWSRDIRTWYSELYRLSEYPFKRQISSEEATAIMLQAEPA